MTNTLTIELENLHFFAEHGLYEEEEKVGNEFVVNLYISYQPAQNVVISIDNTINYVTVYNVVKTEMNTRRLLLETCAMNITESLYHIFPQIQKVNIKIKKTVAPVANFIGTLGVSYTKEF